MATMERELLETFEAAKKAADAAADEDGASSPEAGRCLDALRRLRGFPVTTEVLVSTQVRSGFHNSEGDFSIRGPMFLCLFRWMRAAAAFRGDCGCNAHHCAQFALTRPGSPKFTVCLGDTCSAVLPPFQG
jgi:hypothetical protein